MIEKLNHIGVAVTDIEESIKFFQEKFGAKLIMPKTEFSWQKQYSALIEIGNFQIELMQGMGDDSVVGKFVKEKGEGLHHISICVDDWAKEIADYEAKGLRIIGKTPATKFGFVHPKSNKGVLLEVTVDFAKKK